MTLLSGQHLKDAFAAAVLSLESRRDSINALNVFPVPDGDTGTNMLLTIRAALERVEDSQDITVAKLFRGLADGAFWGARGNSGVIFSQFLVGMAEAFESSGACSGSGLERAFRLGADTAYRSVGDPVEGTMLTVLRSLSPAVAHGLEQGESGPVALWEAAFDASKEALARTPQQLPVLRQAGVVDAGGMGVVVILGGALEHLTGGVHLEVEALSADGGPSHKLPSGIGGGGDGRVNLDHLHGSLGTAWGYCIQFVVQTEDNKALDPKEIRARLTNEGSQSAVVAGGGGAVRVHVHAADPAPVLSYGSSLGALHQIDVQSMVHQNHGFVADQGGNGPIDANPAGVAVIAVASGEGLCGLFLGTGCPRVVEGGQTMNPSVQELLDAARASGAKHTILLPNNPNVVSAARQAAAGNPRIHVVDSSSIPQGVAALLAFSPQLSWEDNLAAMEEALSTVKSIEVTQAVRAATISGMAVSPGQYVALLDNEMAAVDATPEGALRGALAAAGLTQDGLVTVYVGVEGGWREAEDLANRLREEMEGMQVDVIYGGQPHYHHLASVE